jgi:deferrochelatase/peroxidase EfeB
MAGCPFDVSRRGFIGGAAGIAATSLGCAAPLAARAASPGIVPAGIAPKTMIEPFWGAHQGGIATPLQAHSTFAAFDLATSKREDVADLLRAWTDAAAKMTSGQPAAKIAEAPPDAEPGDSGDALELPPARLTITFGFGPGLFIKDGADRYGLARFRPEALIDLPRFNGDQLVPERTGGDLSVQACADDPQVAFHAIRQLARLAYPAARIRWTQNGFTPGFAPGETPRNLMGFKDGTMNVQTRDPKAMERFVWVGDEGQPWMRGGSYVVARPIRIALEHWDRMKLAFQEQTMGRRKTSGAPLGGKHEFDGLNLAAMDSDGNPVVPENSHARLAAPETNDGAQILRRPFSYDNGVNFVAERWPPWRQGMEFDAGLFFVCYQRDPRTGFVKIFENMAKFDMLNQFVTHVGGGLFACPGGPAKGEFIGQKLLEQA